MSVISFKDGSSLEVFGVYENREIYGGAERDFLTIMFPGNIVPYSEIKALYDNPESLQEVQFTEIFLDESKRTVDFTGYTTPVQIISEVKDGIYTISLRLIKPSDSEKEMQDLKDENEQVQMALIELAQYVTELEERILELEGTGEEV